VAGAVAFVTEIDRAFVDAQRVVEIAAEIEVGMDAIADLEATRDEGVEEIGEAGIGTEAHDRRDILSRRTATRAWLRRLTAPLDMKRPHRLDTSRAFNFIGCGDRI
jgi:hypothetical protein